ncbi:MAG: UDP-glucose--hexose-1-phosphate uridylyltransferase [Pelosinus sp.]|nr:UDP-glucose--hexose-1-phosphate uridylyltransferase [Pelosinus sp.]
MNIYEVIQELINQAISLELIEGQDEVYVRNQILHLLNLSDFAGGPAGGSHDTIPQLLDQLVLYACREKIIEEIFDEKEILAAKIMDVFMPKPSGINHKFYEKYQENPREATAWFYALSQNSNYIQTERIAKNINYKAATEYGELDITINLSKPEKNPQDIAKAKTVQSTEYPKCLLCIENEGYAGCIGHPARSNHRLVRLDLLGEAWYLQYSPYVYYNEHCIVLSGKHRDMKIDRMSFARLLKFVEFLPHYFAGSNADLPIVGGSILSHDHYQGGRYEFAMAKAPKESFFTLAKFPLVECALVKWPMSVIRLSSSDQESLISASEHILSKWRAYSDPAVDILAYSGETPHNTITPIARKRGNLFEMDLVLRNNRTTAEQPLGIFHPHQDVQHIKKENIGLIEVMGLAVLPKRLLTELKEVEKYICREPNALAEYHRPWAKELAERYAGQIAPANAEKIVRAETATKFLRVLEDAGVFKRNDKGQAAFKRFVATL